MKILVTGCAGFIGVNFVNYWLDPHPNDKIIGVDYSESGWMSHVEAGKNHKQTTYSNPDKLSN